MPEEYRKKLAGAIFHVVRILVEAAMWKGALEKNRGHLGVRRTRFANVVLY